MSIADYAGPGILKDQFAPCRMMDRITSNASDGQFGTVETYQPGASFDAMLRKDNSPEVRVAERQGLKEQYTVVVNAAVKLRHNDVFRRETDGATFRVTGQTLDGEAPTASTIRIAKTTAERWDIP